MRKNAFKFGIYAKRLPGENEAEYREIAQDLWDELRPRGRMQEILFFQIVEDYLALGRLSLALHAYLLFRQRVVAARATTGERAVYFHEGKRLVKEVEDLLAAELGKEVDLSPFLEDMLRSTVDDGPMADIERRRDRISKSMVRKRKSLKKMQRDDDGEDE
jgi:hypothetical protein